MGFGVQVSDMEPCLLSHRWPSGEGLVYKTNAELRLHRQRFLWRQSPLELRNRAAVLGSPSSRAKQQEGTRGPPSGPPSHCPAQGPSGNSDLHGQQSAVPTCSRVESGKGLTLLQKERSLHQKLELFLSGLGRHAGNRIRTMNVGKTGGTGSQAEPVGAIDRQVQFQTKAHTARRPV